MKRFFLVFLGVVILSAILGEMEKQDSQATKDFRHAKAYSSQ
jgi:hypothetical protein